MKKVRYWLLIVLVYLYAANKLQVDPSECLVIEDSKNGITNAYVAGCKNIIVVNSANKKSKYEKLPGVISIIDTFEEI